MTSLTWRLLMLENHNTQCHSYLLAVSFPSITMVSRVHFTLYTTRQAIYITIKISWNDVTLACFLRYKNGSVQHHVQQLNSLNKND